jgi:hypothetical protein
VEPNAASCRYLATKRDRMGHMLGPNLSKEETGND